MANSLIVLDSVALSIDALKFAEAERNYQLKLSGVGGLSNATAEKAVKSVVCTSDPSGGVSSLSQQVARAREQIASSLRQTLNSTSPSSGPAGEDAMLWEENSKLKASIAALEAQVKKLESRVNALEKGDSKPKSVPSGDAKPVAKKEDDDDVDLFGSDEEEDAEAAKIKEQRLAAYAEKKSKKPTLVAKSNVILDVKPWDDETDMKELERGVREITMDGLLWGASKLVPLAYGINKLTIASVVEDEKVSIDELIEKIQEREDYVQSVDIAAFNKL